MEPKNLPPGYTIRYTMSRAQITDFLNELYDIQAEYIEAAVEASKYKDAIEVINHIRNNLPKEKK